MSSISPPRAPSAKSFRVTLPQLSRNLWTTRLLRSDQPPIEAFEQSREHGRRDPHHSVRNRRPHELAAFQALVHQHQARSIPDENLDPVRPFRSEHEGRAIEGVETKHLLHLRSKPIMAAAKVNRPRRNV